ncbi:MAG: hypothetical protein COW42_12270 [Deltaproteobacteria bacterium CG17_big_fil_post_rev_8_21_14_2_50_63_7]|nr:MAG: hypothetical protein COW42_12270 [Deltaproteobacteria bacterium CG17_big_fil_post_rev_8_21_14_2_50_63_7]
MRHAGGRADVLKFQSLKHRLPLGFDSACRASVLDTPLLSSKAAMALFQSASERPVMARTKPPSQAVRHAVLPVFHPRAAYISP